MRHWNIGLQSLLRSVVAPLNRGRRICNSLRTGEQRMGVLSRSHRVFVFARADIFIAEATCLLQRRLLQLLHYRAPSLLQRRLLYYRGNFFTTEATSLLQKRSLYYRADIFIAEATSLLQRRLLYNRGDLFTTEAASLLHW